MIYCTNCGRELSDDSSFCNACGQPVCRDSGPDMAAGNQPYMQSAAPDPYANAQSSGYGYGQPGSGYESNILAIAAIVASISFSPIGIVIGLIGLNSYNDPSNRRLCKIAIGIGIGLIAFSAILVGIFALCVDYVFKAAWYGI